MPRIGLLSGGYGQEELERAGAYRVYEDPAELLYQIPESLTPAADSRISVDVIQHGKQLLEGLPFYSGHSMKTI